MTQHPVSYAVHALSWIREDGCVKVPHPTSRRLCYLAGDAADVFECIDLGLGTAEILAELGPRYSEFSTERLRELLDLLEGMNLIQKVGQFD